MGKSAPRGGREVFHQRVDFAGGNSHDNALNRADLLFCDFLFPGNAKVVFDSWLTLSGHCRCQPDNCCRAGVEMFCVSNSVIEITVCFVLFRIQHNALKALTLIGGSRWESNPPGTGYAPHRF